MNLILCGMPGSGKTIVGREIALLSGRQFVDTDMLIEARHGAISDIFAGLGEEAFRKFEREAVESLKETDGLVIATGGGLVLDAKNVEVLNKNCKIVYLRTGLETLVARVGKAEERPLLVGAVREKLEKLLQERAEGYESSADFIVETDHKTAKEVAKEILKLGEIT